jgi:hypothetical protein
MVADARITDVDASLLERRRPRREAARRSPRAAAARVEDRLLQLQRLHPDLRRLGETDLLVELLGDRPGL